MSLAYDASSQGSNGTGNLSWTHTPSGTPEVVVVVVAQAGSTSDRVSGITYGGVAMTRKAFITATTCAAYLYLLDAGVPTGAQTVAVTVTGVGTKCGAAMTATGGGGVPTNTGGKTASLNFVSPRTIGTGDGDSTALTCALAVENAGGVPTVGNGTSMGSGSLSGTVTWLFERDGDVDLTWNAGAGGDNAAVVGLSMDEIITSRPPVLVPVGAVNRSGRW